MRVIFFLMLFVSYLQADTTFFVATDPHYGGNQWDYEQVNKNAIYDMNQLPNKAFPQAIGGIINEPKGVIVTGDLTDAGFYWQWFGLSVLRFLHFDGFISDYGLNGENLLNFPVLEGFGNHDELLWGDCVKGSIIERNLQRQEKINISDNGLHYSWDWEGVHLVQLNVYPGDTDEAEMSLSFLKHDLANNITGPKTPIILFQHYGMDGYSDEWWTSEERQNFYDLIKNYNIVMIFQGHQHGLFHLVWKGIDVFSSGDIQTNEFLVCQIDNQKLKIASRKLGEWGDMTFVKKLYQ